jgi:5-methyltetrahydrofolate--homocysteine methyltransferase
MDTLKQLQEHVIAGRRKEVTALTQQLIDEGLKPETILYDGLLPGMSVVGDRFEKGEYFIPEMLLAARSLNAGLDLLRPLLTDADMKPTGTVVLGTVQGDIHDIGKNLVAVMMQGAGFQVIDAGVDVPPERFVELIREHSPDIVGLSALLTTTMPSMEDTMKVFKAENVRDQVKVLIGGAPVTQEYASRIGADGYGRNATAAAQVAVNLVGASA